MGRLCERPGCSEPAAMAFGFDADRLLVWLAARDPDGDPMRAGSLCRRHADAMVVPRGWTLDDRRESSPRLFRAPARRTDRASSPGARRRATPREPAEQLALDDVDDVDDAGDDADRTVAAVTGEPAETDPDATVAIPWMPDFDVTDDLGGVLAADSPLLARAFRGTDRPR